jgi:hypothetical protein
VDGLVTPHSHPRASEMLYVSNGAIIAGFIDTRNKLSFFCPFDSKAILEGHGMGENNPSSNYPWGGPRGVKRWERSSMIVTSERPGWAEGD